MTKSSVLNYTLRYQHSYTSHAGLLVCYPITVCRYW